MDIDELVRELIDREGGYVDHPADRGGPTTWGITQQVARANGYAGPMRDLPVETAIAIYKRLYWTKPGFAFVAEIVPRIAAELFDTGVNMGPATAAKFLQRALNALNRSGGDYLDVKPDGAVGPATLAALAAFLRVRGVKGEAVLLRALQALQGAHYLSLAESRPANEAFLYGWLANRVA
jgi:lysozyme family protein